MKILAVTLRYPPYVAGGYELLTRDAVRGLRARGHEVAVLAGRGRELEREEGVLPWLEPPLDGALDPFEAALAADNAERFRLHFLRLANHRATLRAIRREEPDLLLFFNLSLVSLAPILAARQAEVPTLGYVADPWPENHWLRSWPSDDSGAPHKPARRQFVAHAWRVVRDAVDLGPLLVPSEFLRRRFVESGIAERTVGVLPHGLSPELEAAARRSAPRRRGAREALRVLCTSRLWEGKGQHVLLEALRIVRAAGAPVELALAGGGVDAYRERLERSAADPALAGAVRFAGQLERDELARLFAASHVLALPSLWDEPFGLSNLEAMAFGLAVVASDAGGSSEVVRDAREGRIVPAGDARALADALAELERDEELRSRLAGAGRERALGELTHERFLDGLERAAADARGARGRAPR